MARHGTRIRGTRIGGGPTGDSSRGISAERTEVEYFCPQGHKFQPSFSVQATIPDFWDCPHCGQPAGRDQDNLPVRAAAAPYKTHLAYVRERRSDAEAEVLLNEALARVRGL